MSRYRFSYVPGYFVDGPEAAKACSGSKLTTQLNLGLRERTYDTPGDAAGESLWVRFTKHVEWLNNNSPQGVSYKLLYLLRHGLSVHNMVMEKLGGEAWKVRRVLLKHGLLVPNGVLYMCLTVAAESLVSLRVRR